jgi:hypothetical protein
MKRATSYSDSFLIMGGNGGAGGMATADGLLTPILVPISRNNSVGELGSIQQEERPDWQLQQSNHRPSRSKGVLCFLFTFKGGLHIFLISAFETLFYFLYVNRSENEGIRKTIDTYYQPLVANCRSAWSEETREIVRDLLGALVNQTSLDMAGAEAYREREAYNQTLLSWSIAYSGIFAAFCLGATGYVKWAGWIIPWRRILAENLLFVLLLALYEVFFFRTIIYNYKTLTTAELNQYIVDGLETCSSLG